MKSNGLSFEGWKIPQVSPFAVKGHEFGVRAPDLAPKGLLTAMCAGGLHKGRLGQ